MEEIIGTTIDSIKINDIVTHKNMDVAPLVIEPQSGPEYITMSQGFERQVLSVQEISEGGSVPELLVMNNGDQFILLLDGEEISGAKQNRVLNTSIMVTPKTKIIIPVSCTEQGRWNYTSKEFNDSGILMARSIRSSKQASVTHNVRERKTYRSDQSSIWEEIDSLHADLGTSSGTGAMRDAYESKKEELDGYAQAFSNITECNGIAVFIDGELVGIDSLSYRPAMASLLSKIIGSYSMDAIRSKAEISSQEPGKESVRKFLSHTGRCTLETNSSQGIGDDVRLVGEKIQGAALVVEETVVHLALFSAAKQSTFRGVMTSFSNRRNFRRTPR